MYRFILFLVVISALLLGKESLAAQERDVREIIERCEYKNPGEDQQSILSISLIDKDGNERKNVYKRLWKNYHGEKTS